MKMNNLKILKYIILESLLKSWLVFSLMGFVAAFVAIVVFGETWWHDDPYLFGLMGAPCLFPSIVLSVIIKHLCNKRFASDIAYFIPFVLISLFFISQDLLAVFDIVNCREGCGLGFVVGAFIAFSGILSYFFLKFVPQNRITIFIITLLGTVYLIVYMIVEIKRS